MTQEQLVRKAYKDAYERECEPEIVENLVKFVDLYTMAKALDDFENTQPYFMPKPVNSAKQAALDAAVAVLGREATEITFDPTEKKEPPGSRLVSMAKTIYQWLTEPQTDKR
jgi:hypothetical protein